MSEGEADASGAEPEASRPVRWWRFAIVGAVGGFMSGLFGIGGGIIMVPLLIWLARLDQRRAAATSLAAVVPATIAASIGYFAAGEVDLVPALVVAAGGVVGSWVGARLLRRIPLVWLRWGFIALLVGIAVRLVTTVPDRGSGHLELTPWLIVALVGIGLAVGIASGLFGIGGGVLLVPVFIVLLGMGDLVAKGTSLAVMIPTSITGTVTNTRGHLVDPRQALVAGAASTVCSFGGVALAFLIPPQLGTWLFTALLAFVIAQLTVRAVGAQLAARAKPVGGTE